MNAATIKRTVALALLAGTVTAAATACKPPDQLTTTNCSNGQCVTTHASFGNSQQSGPSTQAPTPSPAATSADPSPSAAPSSDPATTTQPPSPSASASAESAVDCLGSDAPSRDTLVSLTTSTQAGQNLAGCLAIPPAQMNLFLRLIVEAISDALSRGDLDSEQGRAQFTSQTLQSDADRCRNAA